MCTIPYYGLFRQILGILITFLFIVPDNKKFIAIYYYFLLHSLSLCAFHQCPRVCIKKYVLCEENVCRLLCCFYHNPIAKIEIQFAPSGLYPILIIAINKYNLNAKGIRSRFSRILFRAFDLFSHTESLGCTTSWPGYPAFVALLENEVR